MKQIYYCELDLIINSQKSTDYCSNTWWIGTIHPDGLEMYFKNFPEEFDRMLFIAFGKKRKALKAKKLKSFKLIIHHWKEVGFTNN